MLLFFYFYYYFISILIEFCFPILINLFIILRLPSDKNRKLFILFLFSWKFNLQKGGDWNFRNWISQCLWIRNDNKKQMVIASKDEWLKITDEISLLYIKEEKENLEPRARFVRCGFSFLDTYIYFKSYEDQFWRSDNNNRWTFKIGLNLVKSSLNRLFLFPRF